jgi:uncharacterized protein YhaN
VRKQAAVLEERLKPFGGVSIDQAIAEHTERLDHLTVLQRLKRGEAELGGHRENSTTGSDGDATELPNWIPKFLAMLAVSGLLVTLMGAYQAASAVDLVAGAGLTFIGLTGLGLAWGFKRHRDVHLMAGAEKVRERETIAAKIREKTQALAALDAVKADSGGSARTGSVPSQAEGGEAGAGNSHERQIEQASNRLAELQQWAASHRAIQARRKRLSESRGRFQSVQRALSTERQSWCLALKENGLPETVKISEAIETWQRIVTARENLRDAKAANADADQLQRQLATFRSRMREAARRAGRTDTDDGLPLETLVAWEREIESLGGARDDFRRVHREFLQHRRKHRQSADHVRGLRLRRLTLFAKGGARNRAEFLERAGWVNRRAECEDLLAAAKEELRVASESEPDLAIVEDHLVQFNAEENRERIDELALQLEQLEQDLHAAWEELGSVKQSLKALESTCESSRLRFDASQTRYELKRAAEEWLGLAAARSALDRVRSKFERTCQPAVLASASRYLERLTRGRYRNIWTPLGRRELHIDDERGQTLTVAQLSGGTREQLFLSVRMAAVRELAQRGVELPMVFDDVLVNFDQLRTEAAVETLLEFAEQSQQVLFFTCHLHLAHMFEAQGIAPIWLPGHNLPQQERRAG